MMGMAVVSTPSGAALVIVYQTGLSPSGAPITRQRTLNDILYNAPVQAAYDAAYAIFSLSDYDLLDVYFQKTDELINEE